jgi:hypothetical protein
MRAFLLTMALLLPALSAPAQQPAQQPAQPPTGSNWQHVQALPVGASINVKARRSHTGCTLKNVDADTLTCTHGKDIVFQRADILTIQISRRGRSALIGLAIGGGAGAAIGYATSSSCSSGELCILPRGGVVAFNGVLFGIAGAITGALTDFAKSTVYRAP